MFYSKPCKREIFWAGALKWRVNTMIYYYVSHSAQWTRLFHTSMLIDKNFCYCFCSNSRYPDCCCAPW